MKYPEHCTVAYRRKSACATPLIVLTEPVFQFDSAVGFFVAVLHDDWGVEGEIPVCAYAFFDRARARDDYGVLWDVQRSVSSCAVDFAFHQVIERSRAGEDRSSAK